MGPAAGLAGLARLELAKYRHCIRGREDEERGPLFHWRMEDRVEAMVGD